MTLCVCKLFLGHGGWLGKLTDLRWQPNQHIRCTQNGKRACLKETSLQIKAWRADKSDALYSLAHIPLPSLNSGVKMSKSLLPSKFRNWEVPSNFRNRELSKQFQKIASCLSNFRNCEVPSDFRNREVVLHRHLEVTTGSQGRKS